MQKFDIFIKGIAPERFDEADSIRANAAKALQISLSDLDDLLAQPSVCIHRNASEEDAKTYQRMLNKLGLISLYSPVVRSETFELMPMEEELAQKTLICPHCEYEMVIGEDGVEPEKCEQCHVNITKFLEQQKQNEEREAIKAKLLASQTIIDLAQKTLICPHCEYEMVIGEDGVEPEKCEQCHVNITKFLEQQKQNEEREAIKAKLLASQTIIDNERLKVQQEEAEKQRKLEIERQVLQELQADKSKKPLNLKLLVVGGGLAVAAGVGYFLMHPNSQLPVTSTTTTPSLAARETNSSTDVSVQLAVPKKIASPMDAQQAMQKTHDQAAQFLKGFGLDADALANAQTDSASALPPTNDEIMSAVAEVTAQTTNSQPVNVSVESVSTTPISEPNNSTTAATPPIAKKSVAPQTNVNELFTVINGDIAWDSFLTKNSKVLLDRQLPENAAKLSKFIIANDVYVDAIGALLHAAQLSKQTKLVDDNLAAIDTRLALLSTEQQAIYFAQASRYLTLENGTNRLLAKAEQLFSNLQTPESQLNVILKLGVVYSKIGNIEMANHYFNKINGLLTLVTDLDSQAQLRAAVAVAYHEIGNEPVTVQWLSSTEPLLKKLKAETVGELIVSYARCNQWQSVLTLLEGIEVKAQYDLQLYRAIAASLKAGFVTNAIELHKSLRAPVYKVLANILIADYSPATAAGLVTTAEQLLVNLSPAEKAIVASQLVDYYGRLKNTAKIDAFLTVTQDTLANLPASEEKDLLLDAIIKHYVHGLQIKAASNLLTAIQSTAVKTRLNLEITPLADVSGLLK